MSDLTAFSLPHELVGCATICESNAAMCYSHDGSTHKAGLRGYEDIDLLCSDSKASWHNLIDSEAPPAFLETEDSALLKMYSQWLSSGTASILREVTSSDQCMDHPFARKVLTAIQAAFEMKDHITDVVSQAITKSNCDKDTKILTGRECSVIQAIASHCHCQLVAVAYQDDIIKTFGFGSDLALHFILKSKSQKGINCLAWRPLSSFVLAAGCNNGIELWNVNPSTAKSRPGCGLSRFLSHNGHSPVVSVCWSQNGKHLASVSPCDSTVMIWDFVGNMHCKLHTIRYGNALLSWSRCDKRLLVASCGPAFRIWDTHHWSSEKWTNLNGRCQAAAWSRCGGVLVFAVQDEGAIYYLKFTHSGQGDATMTADVAVKCFDTSEQNFQTDTGDVRIGGTVHQMVWDASSSRLAVSFFGEDKHVQPFVAVFRSCLDPLFELIPCGFVVHSGKHPHTLTFLNGFEGGTQLAVCWSDGHLSVIPMYFDTGLVAAPLLQDISSQAPQSHVGLPCVSNQQNTSLLSL